MKKISLTAILLFVFLQCFAAEPIGTVSKYSGRVTVYDGSSPRGIDITETQTPIYQNNIITTNRTSSAVIIMTSGDKVALSENSSLSFPDTGRYEPKNGKTVYSIKKRGAASGLKIGLKTAVIGVKGTEFLIDIADDGTSKVFLKDGEIAVDAIDGDFTKHKAMEIDEYTAFVKKLTGEYDDYMAQMQKEYTDYVQSFTMEAGQAVVISGNDVSDIQYNNDLDTYFDMLND